MTAPPVVTGLTAALSTVRGLKDAADRGAEAGVRQVVDEVHRVADYYCPIDTGDLKASARKEVRRLGPGLVTGFVLYGGPSAHYALWVHEHVEWHHDAPTQAKWLERAVREVTPRSRDIMGGAMKGTITGRTEVTR